MHQTCISTQIVLTCVIGNRLLWQHDCLSNIAGIIKVTMVHYNSHTLDSIKIHLGHTSHVFTKVDSLYVHITVAKFNLSKFSKNKISTMFGHYREHSRRMWPRQKLHDDLRSRLDCRCCIVCNVPHVAEHKGDNGIQLHMREATLRSA